MSPDELRKHFRGDVQYCPEDDIHFPTLSVEQTIKFAATTRTPCQRAGISRDEFADTTTKILSTLLGLREVMTVLVGNAAIRAISGGEKKRVSIAEVLATRPCVGVWDKYNLFFYLLGYTFTDYWHSATRGLDSSTALEFIRALRIATDNLESTTIVSLYQAGESLYQYFDKVCVVYEGRMAYFGRADQAKQYFIDMG